MSDFAYVAARGGTRMPWAAVPALVKDLIADRLGAPVAGAKDQHGGFWGLGSPDERSNGYAAELR